MALDLFETYAVTVNNFGKYDTFSPDARLRYPPPPGGRHAVVTLIFKPSNWEAMFSYVCSLPVSDTETVEKQLCSLINAEHRRFKICMTMDSLFLAVL